MKKILLIILLFVTYECIAQYSMDRIAYDAGPGGNDTLYSKSNTDSLFRLVGAEYVFAIKTKFKKFIASENIIGGVPAEADWADITNKPATFSPSAHGHAIGDVTNLQSSLDAKAPLVSPSLTTPNIGVASGTSLTVTGSLGYGTGAGGTVTQATSKSTGVTLNKIAGRITMNGAALAAAAEVSFTLTNSFISANDVVVVNMQSVGTTTAYLVSVNAVSNGSCVINIANASTGSLSQAIVLNFIVIKSSIN